MASDDWFGERTDRRRGDWFDRMQVCVNGHKITAYGESQPEERQSFCAACGLRTIDACESCETPIRGYKHIEMVGYQDRTTPPRYCPSCGKPFPWQEAALENLKAVIREGDQSESAAREIEAALPDVLTDTPKTQSAALRLRRLLPQLGTATYAVAKTVLSEIASEAAKKALGL